MLPADLKRRAEERARDAGISLGELIRRSLSLTVDAAAVDHRHDPLFADHTAYDGPCPDDVAAEHDAHLYGDAE